MTLNTNTQPDSYTYLETKSGLICYTYGPAVRYDDQHMVCSVVGYFSHQPTNRIQVASGRYVGKFIYEGNEGDLDTTEQFLQAPDEVRQHVKNLVRVNSETGERLLVVSLSEILKIYSPRNALELILSGTSGLGEQKEEAVRKLVKIFNSFGIQQENMGIYGSLGYGILVDSSAKAVDIDVVVYNLENCSKVDKIVEAYKNKEKTLSKYTAINEFLPWRIARERRSSISQICLDKNTNVDIKMARGDRDQISFDFQTYEVESGEWEMEGVVVDDIEGLTYPSVFKVESKGEMYTVGTRLYVFVGAAKIGDRVKVKGRKIKGKNSILVADAREHLIFPL